ncbi:hypothetical protein Emin_1242 [Elusimicrobium minutum Pei191]|uniref:GYF domain-containing protein n=1 Tax=Elusimicrobium minutum (strain Pei191) TaxID=445932 RepID=B2KE46_ELUMP|nr:hypothetical protein [Elusimicrobium minutum]ACC98792.1 hypothetical protein Emin_1242 [Elusimicrobium minutum Pei191]
MRYWVYINNKVMGPYEEGNIPELQGFTPDTLISSEIIEEGASQEWIPARAVLHIPDPILDNVSERHLDTGSVTNTYVAAGDLAKGGEIVGEKEEYTQSAEELLNEIFSLKKEVQNLRKDVNRIIKNTGKPEDTKDVPAADPFEETLTERAHLGKVIAGSNSLDSADDALVTKVESIAEDNTPPQMEMAPVTTVEQTETDLNNENIEGKIIDSFSAVSIVPELNNLKQEEPAEQPAQQIEEPAPKQEEPAQQEPLQETLPQQQDNLKTQEETVQKETAQEQKAQEIQHPVQQQEPMPVPELADMQPVTDSDLGKQKNPAEQHQMPPQPDIESIKIEPISLGTEDALLTQTFTQQNSSIEDDAAVVASALDSLYKAPPVKKEEPAKEETIEFEDLIAPKDAPKEETVFETKMNTVPEIQLNEATSLISDFIPPSEVSKEDDKAASEDVQEIVSPLERTKTAAGPVNDASDNIDLNSPFDTPVVKRVKPTDIKTSPLISAKDTAEFSENTERINDIDQFGTIEETTSYKSAKGNGAKKIMLGLFAVLAIAIIYMGLLFVGIAPDFLNLMGNKEAPEEDISQPNSGLQMPQSIDDIFATQEFNETPASAMSESSSGDGLPFSSIPSSSNNVESQVLSDVRFYLLPTGQILENVINLKHPTATSQIEWTTKEFDADNYVVTVKIPPETPNGLNTIYKFNYNPTTRIITPLTSSSKNILGQ